MRLMAGRAGIEPAAVRLRASSLFEADIGHRVLNESLAPGADLFFLFRDRFEDVTHSSLYLARRENLLRCTSIIEGLGPGAKALEIWQS
jgi:hypothetical protein